MNNMYECFDPLSLYSVLKQEEDLGIQMSEYFVLAFT